MSHSLTASLFGKTRNAVLTLLFRVPGRKFYLREIIRNLSLGAGAVQRELQMLASEGVLTVQREGNLTYFVANPNCPIYPELVGLISKTGGIVDVLRSALNPLQGEIDCAFVYGSVARGEEESESDVDLLVIGDLRMTDLVSRIGKTNALLSRDVNPTRFTPQEFRDRLAAGNHFLQTVVQGPKLFVMGTQDELARVVQGEADLRTSHKPAGNRRTPRHR